MEISKIVNELLYTRINIKKLDKLMVESGYKSNMELIDSKCFERFLKDNMSIKYVNNCSRLDFKFYTYDIHDKRRCRGCVQAPICDKDIDIYCINKNDITVLISDIKRKSVDGTPYLTL